MDGQRERKSEKKHTTTNRIITSEIDQKLALRSLSGSECGQLLEAHPTSSSWSKNVPFIYLYQCQTSQEPGENWVAYLNNSDNVHDRLCTVAH